MTTATLQSIQHRLAQYYLDKLRIASASIKRGHADLAYGLSIFDREWLNIQYWQAWSAQSEADDPERLRLAKEFPLVGFTALYIRETPQTRAAWLQTALVATRRFGDEKAECLILYQLISECYHLTDLEEAEVYVQQLFDRAHASKDRLNVGRAIYSRGLLHAQRGKNSEAQTCYQESLNIFEQLHEEKLQSEALWGLGTIANRLGNVQQGFEYFKRQLEIAEKLGNTSDICSALQAVATGLANLEAYAEAEKYAQRCVNLCRTLRYREVLMAALFVLGECQLEQTHYDEMLATFEEALQITRSINHLRASSHALYCLGTGHFYRGEYSDAIACLCEAAAIAEQLHHRMMRQYVLDKLAMVYLATSDQEKATPALYESIMIAQQIQTAPDQERCVMDAVMLWKLKGLPEQAAIWAGVLVDSPNLDDRVWLPLRNELEESLGTPTYQAALKLGKALGLDGVVSKIISALAGDSQA